jgi:Uma2 family endonuclease
VRAFAAHPAVRLTYDRGVLEIRSPLLEHENSGWVLGQLAWLLTLELGLPVFAGGSVTMRRRRNMKGLEADDYFWIANASRMAGETRLNLKSDPPSDLAIECDVTHSSLDRLDIYAALSVPEVWRLQGDTLIFHVLGPDGTYCSASHSLSFPMVTPADLLAFVQEARQAGDFTVVARRFLEWVRQRRPAP